MNDTIIGNGLAVLYILLVPLLIGACIYNAKTVKKKDRAAAPFVWLTIGLWAAALIGSMLLWVLLHFPFGRQGYTEGFLTVFLTLCGLAASVLLAKRALNGEDERKKRLSRSLRPEHFSNGRAFSRPAFEYWVLESQSSAKKALTAYACCVGGGILLSFLFSKGVGGFGGNIMAVLCIFAGLIAGGAIGKNAGRAADYAAASLGVSREDVAAAKRRLKNGTFAWRADAPAGDGEPRFEETEPVQAAAPPEAVPKEPVEPQTNEKRPRRKMKKWLKITLIAASGVAVVVAGLVIASTIVNAAREENKIAFYQCMYACDVDGAREYAEKLTRNKSTYYPDKVNQMERFLALYDAGSWQEAIAEYDCDYQLVTGGMALAKYGECYYQTQVLPAETALDEGRVRDAIELLLQFQDRFNWVTLYDGDTKTHLCSFRDYSEYFEDHSRHFIELTERAAEASFATGDENIIQLLEGFESYHVQTVPFEDFSWSEDFLAWKAAREAEDQPEEEVVEEQMQTLPENGGSGSYDGTGLLSLYGPDSGQTFRLISAGMVESAGNCFGVYLVPVDGELLQITGSGQQGTLSSKLLVKALIVTADGSVLQPINTSCNVDMINPAESRLIFLFQTTEAPQSLFFYPPEEIESGVFIPLSELTLEKTPDELEWD